MPKILHTAHYEGTPWEILKCVVPKGFTVETLEVPTYECLLRQCVDADYLLVSGRLPIDEDVLSTTKQLKMIQRTGVGTEMLDLKSIKRHNIPVYVNKGVNARSVAEHTLTLMLCCLKNIPKIDRDVKQGIWEKQQTGVTCHELYGKTVGLVGMGAIGRQVAIYLKAFGAEVIYTDPYRLEESLEKDLTLKFSPSFEDLLPQVDILSLHCPLTKDNLTMLNARTLSKMKDKSIIVNTARGKLIDPEALYNVLKSGQIMSAGIDTHYEEPIKGEYRLAELDNVILTPHMGWKGLESRQRLVGILKEAIDGGAVLHVVNQDIGSDT